MDPFLTSLRIGIDGDALRQPLSGVGHYIRSLCSELEELLPNAAMFAYSRLPASALSLPSRRWQLRSEPVPLFRRLPSFMWLKTRCRSICTPDKLDIFWAGRTLHPGSMEGVRIVSTVHDLNHLIVPDTMQLPTRLSHRLWFEADVRSADCLITNSRGTAERVRNLIGAHVHAVVLPGVAGRFSPAASTLNADSSHFMARLGIAPPYLLSVATPEPRKNLAALLEAYVDLKMRGILAGYRLVLVGGHGWKNRVLERQLLAAEPYGVVRTGYVPDDMMPALYGAAEALVFPSLYEGFGMPVLEARASGTKVVVSDIPELREAGGTQAIVIEPSVAGICQGILTAIARRSEEPEDVTRTHSWGKSAEQLAKVLLEAAHCSTARKNSVLQHGAIV
ncbi:MAG: glycosyltransferase family 1 protein [Pseudomonadota bacterium]